jgi:hypothetical protein
MAAFGVATEEGRHALDYADMADRAFFIYLHHGQHRTANNDIEGNGWRRSSDKARGYVDDRGYEEQLSGEDHTAKV